MSVLSDLITVFRKETEDLFKSLIEDTFLIKYFELEATIGDNNVAFTGIPYESGDDYVVSVYSAVDGDGIDVRGELEILDSNKTANGFIISCLTDCSIRLQTGRKIPKMNFWT